MQEKGNYAFIDGQNLHLGTLSSEPSRRIDARKLRIYLRDKYKITKAFYFVGYKNEEYNGFYKMLEDAGFILMFKWPNIDMKTEKKGNVDSDVIFYMMKGLIKNTDDFEKIVLVSGDGDYKNVVDFLVEENRFLKILFPNRKFASSLYKKIRSVFYDDLQNNKDKLERR